MSDTSPDSPNIALNFALADGFLPISREAWLNAVERVLKGAAFDERLVTRSFDGIAIQPLYDQVSSARPQPWPRSAKPWRIIQRLDHPDAKAANALALSDLENGANGLTIVTPCSGFRTEYGLNVDSVESLDTALCDVALDMIDLRVDPGANGEEMAAMVAALVQRRGYRPQDLKIHFGLDPIGELMRTGELALAWADSERRLTDTARWLETAGYSTPFVCCDVRIVHEAGASEAQELGIALAMGVSYLRAFERNGLDLKRASRALSWTIAADADQLLTVAKLRALRELWCRVQEKSQLPRVPIHIHAETAWRMMSRLDSSVNMLRTTMAAVAAGIGGADSISVLPHTLALGLPDELARRIARNLQIILLEESNLWRVTDPVAGSGAYEALTGELCEVAWRFFQEIEGEGGLVSSMMSGRLQGRIAKIRQERQRRIAHRELLLTGTSAFPNLTEAPPTVLKVPRSTRALDPIERSGRDTVSFADSVANLSECPSPSINAWQPGTTLHARALPSKRLSEPFEKLRDAAENARKRTGRRPSVFLATLGSLADYGESATWTENLLATAGIEAVRSEGFFESAAAARAFGSSDCSIACICGSREMYNLLADATVRALKTAGASRVYLAGDPKSQEASLRHSGVDSFLFDGVDIIAALQELQRELGIDGPGM